jgi:hypothetical protein
MEELNRANGEDMSAYLGSSVGDVDDEGNEIAYCFSCGLRFPEEVCESFEPMEDGRETEEKPYAGTEGYDPPLWQFDGLEWRMT